MCLSCLMDAIKEDGATAITPAHLSIAMMVKKLYATPWGECTGGPLHVVLDDYNTDDHLLDPEYVRQMVWWWLEYCRGPFTEDDLNLVLTIAAELADMPTDADRALAIHLGHQPEQLAVIVETELKPGTVLAMKDRGLVAYIPTTEEHHP